MKVISLSPIAWEANSYLLTENGKALLIDAGADSERISKTLVREQADLVGILLTHGHFDHILSVDLLRQKYNAPVYVHTDDAPMLTNGRLNAYTHFFGLDKAWQPADRLVKDTDTIWLEGNQITVMHTPGHTRGSVCYLVDDLVFSGDTVFADGYGRTDLEGGSPDSLTQSLKKLLALPSTHTVYSGHGRVSSLEKIKYNLGFL